MFETVHKVHIVGVGGIGVSAMAQYFLSEGKEVSGSDMSSTPWTAALAKKGITISELHSPKNVDTSVDLVIHSLAVPTDHIELKAARELGIEIMSYPKALGVLTKNHRTIAVCGTHGKTTTTSMLAKVLIDAGIDPTVVVGTRLTDFGGSNFRKGASDILLIEACEYMNAFLNYSPEIIVITNIEHDHFDVFPTLESYINVFKKFIAKVNSPGKVVANYDDTNIKELIDSEANTFSYKNIDTRLKLNVPGQHNRINAQAALETAKLLRIEESKAIASLNTFTGSARRLELKREIDGTKIYDDYAHHPTEIRATLQALREVYPNAKICTIFQPHQYSRTKHLLAEFGNAFEKSDHVVIPNIYEARDREEDREAVGVNELVKKIGDKAENGGGVEKTTSWLKENFGEFDIFITMGAGDIWKVWDLMVA